MWVVIKKTLNKMARVLTVDVQNPRTIFLLATERTLETYGVAT
jgi:hypothetical protein